MTREEQLQEDLLRNWNAEVKRARGEKVSEWDLARRISAATEGDTREERVKEAIRDHKIAEKFDEKLRERIKTGQSEEEFYQERKEWGDFARKALREARQEV